MDLALSPQDEAFRDEVRRFLDGNLTEDLREAGRKTGGVFADVDRRPALAQGAGQARLVGADLADGIWRHRLDRHPALHLRPGMHCRRRAAHLRHGHPHGGTRDHEVRHPRAEGQVPAARSCRASIYWCQGYSEPGSGSDLASLKTRAVRDGDDYVVNGTKIWTTGALRRPHVLPGAYRDRGQAAGRHLFRADRFDETPGLTVKPIVTLAGDHEVNQVFFDNVRTPVANRIGPENAGWTVAKYLLEFERGGDAYTPQPLRPHRGAQAIAERSSRTAPPPVRGSHGFARAARRDRDGVAGSEMIADAGECRTQPRREPGARSSWPRRSAASRPCSSC